MKFQAVSVISAALVGAVNALKIGFLGDSGAEAGAATNFAIMRAAGVDVFAGLGDLDYESDPEKWDNFLVSNWLQYGLPGFTTSGNHEDDFISTVLDGGKKWEGRGGYKERMYNRLVEMGWSNKCSGRNGRSLQDDYGNFMYCQISNDIDVVMVGWDQMSDSLIGPGGDADEVNGFLEDKLSKSTAKWKLCIWHRPEGALNPGNKHTGNYGSMEAYERCARYGAMVFNGHSHVYGKTKLIEDFHNLRVSSTDRSNRVQLDCGKTIAVINGMGGSSIHDRGDNAGKSHMRSSYTTANGSAENGVLVCDFGSSNALCRFYVGQGELFDEFVVYPPTKTCPGDAPPAEDKNPWYWGLIGGLFGALSAGVFVYKRRNSKRELNPEVVAENPMAEVQMGTEVRPDRTESL